MPCTELESRCARIKTIASEIERFPSEGLVRQLCNEAEAGCRIDPRCAFWFFSVRDVALDLLGEGCWWASEKLPAVVQMLEAVVTARLMYDVGAGESRGSER